MRLRWIALLMLVLLPGLDAHQQAAPDPGRMLDWTLRSWEQAMARLDRFAVTCRRTTTDKVFGTVETHGGWALFRKGTAGQPTQARLKLTSTRNKQQYEELLYTGTQLYVWLPATKVLQVHPVPPRKPGQPLLDDNIVALLFGITAQAARDRYQMEWLPDPMKTYHYIRVRPRRDSDKADFTEAQLSLWATTFLPRQLTYTQPNGNVIQWDFVDLKQNDPRLNAASFAAPKTLPPDWRVDRIASPTPAAAGAAPKR